MVPTYPSYMQLRKYDLMAFSNNLFQYGLKKIRRIGHTMEFEQIKEYVQGDDLRTINWKATAKKNQLMVNQYQDEKSQNVYMVIDKGRVMKMPFNDLSLLDYAINATLVLSNVIIKKQDKAGIFAFSKKVENRVVAEKRQSQMQQIMENLYNIKTDFFESGSLQICSGGSAGEFYAVIQKGSSLPGPDHVIDLMKFDAAGVLQWECQLPPYVSFGNFSSGSQLDITPDGTVWAVHGIGDTQFAPNGQSFNQVLLFKVSPAGHMQLRNSYKTAEQSTANGVFVKGNEEIYVYGGLGHSVGNGFLLKVKADGAIQWARQYDGLFFTRDGGIFENGDVLLYSAQIEDVEPCLPARAANWSRESNWYVSSRAPLVSHRSSRGASMSRSGSWAAPSGPLVPLCAIPSTICWRSRPCLWLPSPTWAS